MVRNLYSLIYLHVMTVKDDVEFANCTEDEARLVNGPSLYKGRLEVCINQAWMTVCSQGFGFEESRTACDQLGYPRYGTNIL